MIFNIVSKLLGSDKIIDGVVGLFKQHQDGKLTKEELKFKIATFAESNSHEIDLAAADIVKTEAQSENFLVSSWRPIVMLFLTGLIGAHWLGFTPENLTEAEVLALLDIVQVGLGGYVLGRSGEKMVKAYKETK